MSAWLEKIKTEMESVKNDGTLEAQMQEQHLKEEFIGVVPEDLRKIYLLHQEYSRKLAEAVAVSETLFGALREEKLAEVRSLEKQAITIFDIFWVSFRTLFPNTWNKSVAIRKGWRAVFVEVKIVTQADLQAYLERVKAGTEDEELPVPPRSKMH